MANEKRLIDANALQRKLVELGAEPDYQHTGEDWGVGVCMAEGIVDEMPTVDAVEVVRCNDCKHWKLIDGLEPHWECQIFCGLHDYGYLTGADDFCSYGERKDND